MASSSSSSSSSSKKYCKSRATSLADLVFSWSPEDIFNEELYKYQVEKIPECFQSVKQYLGSFTYPLLEETRAELCSSMEVISKAPYAEVILLQEAKPWGSSLYDVSVDSWRNTSSRAGKESYKPKPSDVFALCDAVPEDVSDLERYGRTWTFGLVTRVSEEEISVTTDSNTTVSDGMPTQFKVKTSKPIEVKEGMRTSLYAVFLINVTTNHRMWTAFHMFGNLDIINGVLGSNSSVEENCNLCSAQTDSSWRENFVASLSSSLNGSQIDAIVTAITTMQCKHKPSLKLIWGPPGTGKTTTVSTLLSSLLKMNYRTVMCAPTNVAVTEVASRVLKLVKESYVMDPRMEHQFFSLGDLLLFGNKDRLKVSDDLEDIYLDYRVDRLVECFGPKTGWKCCVTSMMGLLEDCVVEYHTYLENYSSKGNGNDEKVCSTFLEFIRKRYEVTAIPLIRSINILCTHLTLSFLLQRNFDTMVYLVDVLESFGSLLFQNDALGIELEILFARPKVVESTNVSSSETCGCVN